MGVMRAATPLTVYNNDGTSEYKNNGLSFMGDISFVFLTDRLNILYGITDILGYTDMKGNKNIKWNATSDSTIGGRAAGDIVYLIRQSDLPSPPQNYKELVQKTADAYRKKSGTTAQVSIGELPDKIRSLEVEGGVPPNGREWKQSNVDTGTFTHICCGENGVWVAAGRNVLYYSLDGINWIKSDNVITDCTALCYANGIFVMGCENSSGVSSMPYSCDGIHWMYTMDIYGDNSTDIQYGGGLWIAEIGRQLYSSTDGKNWNFINFPENKSVISLYYAEETGWVCSAASQIGMSINGKDWDFKEIGDSFESIYSADGVFIYGSMGYHGLKYSTDNGLTIQQSNIHDGIYDKIIYGNGVFMARSSDNQYLHYSKDGKVWNDSELMSLNTGARIYGLAYSNGIFIASLYNEREIKHYIASSADGINFNLIEVNSYFKICEYANGIWVSDLDAGLYYSLASFDRSPAPMPVEDTSWATASEAKITSMLADAKAGKINLEDYWKVGDMRKITLDNKSHSGGAGNMTTSNEEVELVLAEPLSASTSYGARNGFIVTTKNCLKTKMKMNSNGTNTGSFAGSNMCAFLNDSVNGFLGMLPDWLANNLLIANVKTADPYNGTTIKITQHKVFLPTEREIFGDGYGYEGMGCSNNTEAKLAELKHWKYYQTTSNRVKQVNGSNDYWWERSPYFGSGSYFCNVSGYGGASIDDAFISYGVAPCFCIGTP